MRGKFYESEYEEALIDLLQDEGWQYTNGGNIHRQLREPLLIEDPNVNDLQVYLQHRYPDLTSSDVNEVVNYLRHVPGQTHFERLRNTFRLVRDGYRYTRHGDGVNFDIRFIDFESPDCKKYNIFRAVNQFEVAYGMKDEVRIPDVLLFVNGIPLCIFELKNPTKLDADIAQAYEQIHIRYMRDIPHLLRYCPLSCISDATDNNTRLGTTYTPYEHYYAWKKVNNEDPSAQKGIDQVRTIVKGVYEPSRFLEILRDYVYFPDEKSGKEEEIVCRYPQFFATRMMSDSIRRAFKEQTSKGGTYFGATGCGKTYTMMFIARQLALRCKELGSPTVIMIVDRDDLQTQAGKLFLRSQDFLQLGTVKVIADREELKTELSLRDSGGFFICTIQKFCEAIGELNTRRNIICFSDEAHRTQIRLSNKIKVVELKDIEAKVEQTSGGELAVRMIDESKIGAFVTKPYAEQLRTAFPNATFVIVVDMWITGFDVPCLTYLYNDKPLQKHTLVQTVSRVNRKYPGKDFGYIIDYIGIRNNMMEAMKKYGGETFGPSEDDVQQALGALLVELELINQLFVGFNLKPFIDKNSKPLDRLECLGKASEHVLTLSKMYNVAKEGKKPKKVDAKTFFLAHIKRLKTAYDICQPSNVLNHEQLSLSQCYMCVATYIRKASGEKHDTESMNRVVQRMVAEALQCNSVVSILDTDVEESIFSPGFIEQLNGVKLPATRLEVLVKMLRKSIAQYKNTNKFAAEKFEDLLKKTLEEYHNRRVALSSAEATQTQKETVDEIIRNATQQALDILGKLGEDKESFRKLGLTFEEKAFYDILMHMRDAHNFEYGTDRKVGSLIINDKCKALAKKVKELIDTKSCFADWLSNTNVRAALNQELWFLLDENGYPPEWSEDVFDQVLDQVENYKEHQSAPRLYSVNTDYYPSMVAEP